MTETRPPLRVGMIGYGFMGRAHSHAWRTLNAFFQVPYQVELAAVCGRNEDDVATAAGTMGWRSYETDWRRLIERDDIDVVDVCAPGGMHRDIAVAALEAGKHVLCEKPLAHGIDDARKMARVAADASTNGVRSMVGFNYRRVPAAALAGELVRSGRLGEIRHIRAVYLQDWIVDPEVPLAWRLVKETAGSGALGDIGSHIVDLTQFICGQKITGVSGLMETFVNERPLPAADGPSSERGRVTVDDCALFVARLDGGAVATYEATRFATGRKNGLRLEINGSKGSVSFDLERLNELEVYLSDTDDEVNGFRRVLVTEDHHPYVSAWWPPGHIIGWEHSFTHEIRDLVAAIADGANPTPSFDDGLQVQLVLDAVERSSKSGSAWTDVEQAQELAPAHEGRR